MTFHFKSFSIHQKQSAMKVGTDGVLLGAWVNPKTYPHNILDVGTGTGLIAIMLAQRFSESKIKAIEIDKLTAQEAQLNARSCPWSERISVKHCALQNYSNTTAFDLIVSNPPYFRNTSKSKDKGRVLARINDTLTLEYLIKQSYKLLNNEGMLSIIVPSNEYDNILSSAHKNGFFITQMCWVKGNHNSPVKRLMVSLSKNNDNILENHLTIENSRHNYTKEYKELCRDFYLKL